MVPVDFHTTDQDLLDSVEQERCPQCTERRPVGVMIEESDGIRRCPDCLVVRTPVDVARILAHDAAVIGALQTRPQISRMPLNESTPPHIRIFEDDNGARVLPQSAPLVIARSGTAVLVLIGGDFASTDEFTYTSGISDSVAPSLSGSTQWTLTLAASGGTSTGFKHLTFNDHTYRNIFLVV